MQVYKFRELLRAKQARSTPNPPKDSPMTSEEQTPTEPTQASSTEAKPAGRGRPGRRPGGENTRAGWIRALPLDMPVKEVVEKAKEKGWEMSEGYVYAIRSKMKAPKKVPKKVAEKAPVRGAKGPKKGKDKASKAAAAPSKAAGKPKRGRPGRKKAEEKSGAESEGTLFRKPAEADVRKVEEEFAKLALEIGLLRSGQLLEELKGRLAELVRPRGR